MTAIMQPTSNNCGFEIDPKPYSYESYLTPDVTKISLLREVHKWVMTVEKLVPVYVEALTYLGENIPCFDNTNLVFVFVFFI